MSGSEIVSSRRNMSEVAETRSPYDWEQVLREQGKNSKYLRTRILLMNLNGIEKNCNLDEYLEENLNIILSDERVRILGEIEEAADRNDEQGFNRDPDAELEHLRTELTKFLSEQELQEEIEFLVRQNKNGGQERLMAEYQKYLEIVKELESKEEQKPAVSASQQGGKRTPKIEYITEGFERPDISGFLSNPPEFVKNVDIPFPSGFAVACYLRPEKKGQQMDAKYLQEQFEKKWRQNLEDRYYSTKNLKIVDVGDLEIFIDGWNNEFKRKVEVELTKLGRSELLEEFEKNFTVLRYTDEQKSEIVNNYLKALYMEALSEEEAQKFNPAKKSGVLEQDAPGGSSGQAEAIAGGLPEVLEDLPEEQLGGLISTKRVPKRGRGDGENQGTQRKGGMPAKVYADPESLTEASPEENAAPAEAGEERKENDFYKDIFTVTESKRLKLDRKFQVHGAEQSKWWSVNLPPVFFLAKPEEKQIYEKSLTQAVEANGGSLFVQFVLEGDTLKVCFRNKDLTGVYKNDIVVDSWSQERVEKQFREAGVSIPTKQYLDKKKGDKYVEPADFVWVKDIEKSLRNLGVEGFSPRHRVSFNQKMWDTAVYELWKKEIGEERVKELEALVNKREVKAERRFSEEEEGKWTENIGSERAKAVGSVAQEFYKENGGNFLYMADEIAALREKCGESKGQATVAEVVRVLARTNLRPEKLNIFASLLPLGIGSLMKRVQGLDEDSVKLDELDSWGRVRRVPITYDATGESRSSGSEDINSEKYSLVFTGTKAELLLIAIFLLREKPEDWDYAGKRDEGEVPKRQNAAAFVADLERTAPATVIQESDLAAYLKAMGKN